MFWRVIKGIWISIGLVCALLGFILLPKDLADTSDALKIWQQIWPLSRESSLLAFCTVCVAYALWRDFEESILPMFAHRIGLAKDTHIPVVEMARIAKQSFSWKIFDKDSLDVLDFVDGLGEAMATGAIAAIGRHNPENYSNIRILYPRSISADHWDDHYFEAFSAIYVGDNLQAISRPRHKSTPIRIFMDIRVDRVQALKWLRREGGKWKGKQDAKRLQEAAQICEPPVAASEH